MRKLTFYGRGQCARPLTLYLLAYFESSSALYLSQLTTETSSFLLGRFGPTHLVNAPQAYMHCTYVVRLYNQPFCHSLATPYSRQSLARAKTGHAQRQERAVGTTNMATTCLMSSLIAPTSTCHDASGACSRHLDYHRLAQHTICACAL